MLIRDLPEDERPRERLAEAGAASLSNAELLAVFFGTGRQGASAVDLGREVIGRFGSLRELSRASFEELKQIDGIGPAKAAQLAALIEFGNRLSKERFLETAVTSPEEVFDLVGPEMQSLSQESVRAILLNHRKKLIKISEVFVGTGNESFANPSEILRHAISHSSHALILVHNHPSGDPSPSHADRHATSRMKAACEAIGIEFTDHVIIGCHSEERGEAYFSFREAGLI
ncbi:MAG: DNA repair protein RadC [Verrucomicrobiota bacterium]